MSSAKRLSRELARMRDSPLPPGITVNATPDLQRWRMNIEVLDDANPLYAGKTFCLQFVFPAAYPIEAPKCAFVKDEPGREIPMHPHIYSCGIICLDLLNTREGWSPVASVESVCVSIQSMLASNTKNERPPQDGSMSVKHSSAANFIYDDPTV